MVAWVAGLGALLLLAAAATFLAVRWDALGAVARIATVGGVTVAAVIGGDRLRRTLPAVGGVLYHLGALLVPIDALGLALQFGAPGWARWLAVGVTGIVFLPLLAVLGRSPLLGVVALLGVPVTATGVGILTGVAPGVLVAATGLLLLPLAGRERPEPLAPAFSLGSLVLPVFAIVGGAGAHLGVAVGVEGLGVTAASAGWLASWPVRAGTTALVLTALGVRARRGDARLLTVAVVTGTVGLLHLVLPPETPRVVRLWTPGMLWLGLELARLAVARAAGSGGAARVGRGLPGVLLTAELLAIPVALAVIRVVFQPSVVATDAVLGGAVCIAGLAWASVTWRLARHGDALLGAEVDGRPAAPLVGLLALWHLVAAGVLAGGDLRLLLAAVLLVAALLLLSRVTGWRTSTTPRTAAVELVAVLLLLGGTEGLSAGRVDALVVALVAPLLVLPLLAPLVARGLAATGLVTVPAALLLVAIVGTFGATGLVAGQLPVGLAGVLVGVTALAIAAVSRAARPLADAGRAVAALAGLTATLPAGALVPWQVADPVVPRLVSELGGPSSGALLPSLLLGLLLVVDALRDRSPLSVTAASLVLLRAAGALSLAGGIDVEVVGAVLLAVGTTAALVAGVGAASLPRAAVIAGAVVAVIVAPMGWWLLGDAAVLRASALLVVGTGGLAIGLAARRWALAHIGAAIATVGTWSLLVELGRTDLDLFLLPVAVQLGLAGAGSRRAGDTSSWIAYAPAILLVGLPAVLERVWGGPGWHGLLAGAVGVAAVTIGGARGLRGPLLVGVGLVVAVVVVETLAVVVGVPTWAWLTAGGVALIGAAAVMERFARTPGDAGRRLASGLRDRG